MAVLTANLAETPLDNSFCEEDDGYLIYMLTGFCKVAKVPFVLNPVLSW